VPGRSTKVCLWMIPACSDIWRRDGAVRDTLGRLRYRAAMARKKRYLTATMADGYVKTIGPTAARLTHYWRIVAHLHDGKTEVFWGHASSAKDAAAKEALTEQAAQRHGWQRYEFEVVALTEH